MLLNKLWTAMKKLGDTNVELWGASLEKMIKIEIAFCEDVSWDCEIWGVFVKFR